MLEIELAALSRTADSPAADDVAVAAELAAGVGAAAADADAGAEAEVEVAEAPKVGVLALAVSPRRGALSPKMNCLTTFSISSGSFGKLSTSARCSPITIVHADSSVYRALAPTSRRLSGARGAENRAHLSRSSLGIHLLPPVLLKKRCE